MDVNDLDPAYFQIRLHGAEKRRPRPLQAIPSREVPIRQIARSRQQPFRRAYYLRRIGL